VFVQFVVLGCISVMLNTTADFVVAIVAGPIGKRLRSSALLRRRQRIATGGALIGLGAYVAASGEK
jgi:threonine/homoserine/homoserine lactone efflux protein